MRAAVLPWGEMSWNKHCFTVVPSLLAGTSNSLFIHWLAKLEWGIVLDLQQKEEDQPGCSNADFGANASKGEGQGNLGWGETGSWALKDASAFMKGFRSGSTAWEGRRTPWPQTRSGLRGEERLLVSDEGGSQGPGCHGLMKHWAPWST